MTMRPSFRHYIDGHNDCTPVFVRDSIISISSLFRRPPMILRWWATTARSRDDVDNGRLAGNGVVAYFEPRAVVNIRRFGARCVKLERVCQGSR